MNWQDVRIQYPETWLLVEATAAHSENDFRILDDLLVLETFRDSSPVWDAYRAASYREPKGEFYILHTSNAEISIQEKWKSGPGGLR